MDLTPSYDSRGLVNLIAEIENRLIGNALSPSLSPDIAGAIPPAETYVLVMFDGLGDAQLDHQGATTFRDSRVATLEAGFPTSTSVSLATVATGLTPAQHGVIAHLSWMPEHDKVVNTLKWVDMAGVPVPHDYDGFLPRPNLWERLRNAGLEPITIQPADFQMSPLTRTLYRGARFEGIWDYVDLIDATVQLAGKPGRFVFTYVPEVDVAGHVFGLESSEFSDAIGRAAGIWDAIRNRLPPGATLLGTADHGLIGFSEDQKQLVRDRAFDGLRLGGDARGVHLWCEDDVAEILRAQTGGTLADPTTLVGPDPTPQTLERLGARVLLAAQDRVILPRGFDKRLKAYHGGLDRREVEIPLLIG
jgi:predicted AlkP superfamily pyrophosphatase or phosphodiesterase